MALFSPDLLLATAMFAADAIPAQPGQPGANEMLKLLGPLVLMFVIFYFMLIRPQQKKAKEHQALLKALKVKDKVVTGGGLLGEVTAVREKTVSIRCGEAKLEVLKSAVSEVVERAPADAKS